MTKKDFQLQAEALGSVLMQNRITEPAAVKNAARLFAAKLAASNPRFKPGLFVDAVVEAVAVGTANPPIRIVPMSEIAECKHHRLDPGHYIPRHRIEED